MKKIFNLILLLLFLGGGYYVYRTYFSNAPVPQFLVQLEHKISGSDDRSPPNIVFNTDLKSEVAVVGTTEGKTSFVAFKKRVGNRLILDRIVLTAEDGTKGTVIIGSNGKPERFEMNGYILTYDNYTKESVDITITDPDGNVRTITDRPTWSQEKTAKAGVIATAHAADILEPVLFDKDGAELNDDFSGMLPEQTSILATETTAAPVLTDGQIQGGIDVLGPVSEKIIDSLMENTVLTIQILACGASIPAVAFGGPAGVPLLTYGCGGVASNLVEDYLEIPPCASAAVKLVAGDKDVSECAEDVIRTVIAEITKRRGPQIGGIIIDRATEEPIANASIRLYKDGGLAGRAASGPHGHYHLPKKDIGNYSLEVFTDELGTETFDVTFTDRVIEVAHEDGTPVIDQGFSLEKRLYFKTVPGYYGREVNLAHHVRLDLLVGDEPLNFDGKWRGTALSPDKEVPDPTEPGETIYCGGSAVVEWEITDGKLSGTATVREGNEDFVAPLTGEVDGKGNIKGGMLSTVLNLLTFEGTLDAETYTGGGQWTAQTGCDGEWFASREDTPETPPPSGEEELLF